MMTNRPPLRPVAGGTNQGLRPLQYDYWRVGYGSAAGLPLTFWIDRAGEFRTRAGEYEASEQNHPQSSQFYFHLEGRATIEANGGSYPVHAGDVLGMPLGVPFRYRSRGVIRYHWLGISGYWPDVLGPADRVHWLAAGFDAELEARFVEIRETLILNRPGYALRAVGLFYELMARVFEQSGPADRGHSAYPDAVRNALVYLRENYRRPYDAAGTAAAVGVSQSHLRALFEKWVGESPQKFHARCRIDEARRLLYQDDLTVAQIALQIGFTDPRYFSRVFKQMTGLPPSRYVAAHSAA